MDNPSPGQEPLEASSGGQYPHLGGDSFVGWLKINKCYDVNQKSDETYTNN